MKVTIKTFNDEFQIESDYAMTARDLRCKLSARSAKGRAANCFSIQRPFESGNVPLMDTDSIVDGETLCVMACRTPPIRFIESGEIRLSTMEDLVSVFNGAKKARRVIEVYGVKCADRINPAEILNAHMRENGGSAEEEYSWGEIADTYGLSFWTAGDKNLVDIAHSTEFQFQALF